jgi:hypothetical protein
MLHLALVHPKVLLLIWHALPRQHVLVQLKPRPLAS